MKGLILVHGGAGVMRSLAGERADAYRNGLIEAARLGRDALAGGEDALEAVLVATRYMESTGTFNAGTGSCLDEDGCYALDAALMRGSDRAAGAVGAIAATRHPVDVCRDLIEEDRHVLLVGAGADRRAERLGLPPLPAPPPEKLATYREMLAKQGASPEDLTSVGRPDDEREEAVGRPDEESQDTVGAVAVDAQGRVAAAVSTGGLWLKAKGRVGDSAIVGAGLMACDNLGAAASSTGIGERMMRALTCQVACDVASREGAAAGAEESSADLAARFGEGSGGVVVVDKHGNAGAAFNTRGMGRALARVGEDAIPVAIWPEDPFPI